MERWRLRFSHFLIILFMDNSTGVNILDQVINFFNHPFFILVGWFSTLVMITGFLYTICIVLRWVVPVWYRLWLWLRKRRIAIFANSDFSDLAAVISSSKIFNEIKQIHKNSLWAAEDETIFLVHWKENADVLDKILSLKKDSTPLIVYAPTNEWRIDDTNMEKINSHRNSVVVNFKWRLMNDILTSIITTSYDK